MKSKKYIQNLKRYPEMISKLTEKYKDWYFSIAHPDTYREVRAKEKVYSSIAQLVRAPDC